VLDVLRRLVGWLDAPADRALPLGAQALDRDLDAFARAVRDAGRAMAAALPARDPAAQATSLEVLAVLALALPLGTDGIPLDEGSFDEQALPVGPALELAGSGVTLAQALSIAKLGGTPAARLKIAGWVAEGLELAQVRAYATTMSIEPLSQVPDVRAARAYATWATRLAAHYKAAGVAFTLAPELFASLPRNEDLAVLAICLMEHVDPRDANANANAKTRADPLAVLDATLGLFQRLPTKARSILKKLRNVGVSEKGEGRRLYPDLAAWLGDDQLLDRYVHVARLAREQVDHAGRPRMSSAVREDFEHAERTHGEREHLARLEARSVPQQGRLDALLRAERTLAGSPRGRTRRRIGERITELLPRAYRNELDATFREILVEAWNIAVPSLTPAWRDAVRLWLVVDENRELLGQLLRKAAAAPGRDVKDAFPANRAFCAREQKHLDVEAWCAPRRKHFDVDGIRYELALEVDPLEVLRMGIPFGTCLATDGVNAASVVLNAIDANKRVLYVRNDAGRVVARKLLAISKEHAIVGYNLYVSVSGPAELAIRAAVLEACRALAHRTGASLASRGEPATIHDGFWYDDGTVPFEGELDVARYCEHLELPPPPKTYDSIAEEAGAFCARERGDGDEALARLVGTSGAAAREHGAFVVEKLGPRGAAKKAKGDASVYPPLARVLLVAPTARTPEDGMVHALEVAARLPSRSIHRGFVEALLARFPPSAKIAAALADVASRALRRAKRPATHFFADLSMQEIPAALEDVAGAFDVLDTIEPGWAGVEPRARAAAIERAANVVEALFDRVPDPDVVTATLMNRRRGAISHRAAIRIAARHALPNGARALQRFSALRPALARSGDGLAAFVRQAGVDRIDDALAAAAPAVTVPVFESLRDLVLRCDGLERVLPDRGRVRDVDAWQPGPWELAWRRRRRQHPEERELREALSVRAGASRYTVTIALEQLALLGDRERVGALEQAPSDQRRVLREAAPKNPPRKPAYEDRLAYRRVVTSLAAQVEAAAQEQLDPTLTLDPWVDAGYAAVARRVLFDPRATGDDREHARAALVMAVTGPHGYGIVDRQRLLAEVAEAVDDATAIRLLEVKTWPRILPPRLVVDLWQLPGARPALADAISRLRRDEWAARVWAAEREARARGLDVEGLLESISLSLLRLDAADEATAVESMDQLRSVATAIAREAAPASVVGAVASAEDALTASVLVRAVRRQPRDRIAAIREAASKVDRAEGRAQAAAFWLGRLDPAASPKASRGAEGARTSSGAEGRVLLVSSS
jgi:hypothetical protein